MQGSIPHACMHEALANLIRMQEVRSMHDYKSCIISNSIKFCHDDNHSSLQNMGREY